MLDADEPERSFARAELRLRLPDGSAQTDALDDAAHVRADDVQSGQCWFELTDVPREPGREPFGQQRAGGAGVQSGEAKQSSMPPVSKDDLDIPTFLRNRR